MRALAVLATLFPDILIGASITFTPRNLYQACEMTGRIRGLGQAFDHQIGGLLIWRPGSMMTVIGALIVFVRWTREESARPLTYQQKRHREALRKE